MSILITRARKDIIDFIKKFYEDNGYMPTVREIGFGVNQNNPSVIQYHLNKLEDSGLIKRGEGYIRDIDLTIGDDLVISGKIRKYDKSKNRAVRIPIDKKQSMLDYFGGCAYCGTKQDIYHKEHFVPFVLGGSNESHNILLVCQVCNLSKGSKDPVLWVIDNFGVEKLNKIVLFLGTR